VSVPKVNLDTIITDNKDIHDYIDESFNADSERWKNDRMGRTEHTRYNRSTQEFETIKLSDNIFEDVDKEFYKFKNNAKKEVSYLVKEFECKKSADAYARSSTARTGVLDTSKLHTYKYNEDLFKKVTVVPDGKNHGMIFILDWSGSMCYELLATVKQLINLTSFCKKVQIPFEVYAFTNEWKSSTKCYREWYTIRESFIPP
jgi:hypothetical protein